MKIINTLALIAGAMVVTTEAVKLRDLDTWSKDRDGNGSLAEQFVNLVYRLTDTDKDGKLTVEEF